ncbi:endonuclease/exonuclease/phosphatase family protein [Schaalia sp. ZJ405]|uniref:exodeoxyribonuclease III n=1 Tax=Schaalia sp. ZJ405 TaxID=2709403 RepID=UPI0013EE14EA|nr:exodeoxyribonuclease III [Schaalia sp. ZJ405]QPK81058.1 endonuclease/exonuclease/phosphatase family protein [Schaalia sp. ZJ405]
MRFASWNVNSIRTRIDRVIAFLERSQVDVLALQEIKCRPDQFPVEAFTQAGYDVHALGLNQWNGVAVVSRLPILNVTENFPDQPAFGDPGVVEARALGVTVRLRDALDAASSSSPENPGNTGEDAEEPSIPAQAEKLTVWSLYVPNGRELDHPHYAYKLDWLDKLRVCAKGWLADDPEALIALVGDWNVAPQDSDVWDIKAFEGATHVSAPERAAFAAFADDGWVEVTRDRVDQYTYWDYQKLRFPKNEGMRIDFAYCSPALAARVDGAAIDRNERKGKGASDHVPIIVDIH